MARPKGTKYVKTPENMLEYFEAYKKEVKDNPRFVYDFVGRNGEKVKKPLERPLTFEGFKNYCHKVVGCVEQYFTNQDGLYEDYIGICSRIKQEIRQDQIEGGMVGQYNPSITQRLNGLVDKKEVDNKGGVKIFNGIDLNAEEDNSSNKDS